MYEAYIEENTTGGIGSANRPGTAAQLQQRSRNVQDRGGVFGQAYRAINRSFGAKEPSWDKADRDDRRREQTALNRSSNPTTTAAKPTSKFADLRGSNTPGSNTPLTKTNTPTTPKPSATPTPTTAPKPTAPKPAAAPAAKPAGSAMDQWAKANPKLAAAKAERDRTRGTSATTNPLMKDMKSKLSAPKSPSPSTAKTGFDLAKKGVNLAAGVDLFDVVKGYLLDEGYAESEDAAMVIMVNMSEEWRETIIMELTGGKGHPGYKAGSKDHGDLEDHPAAGKKGGVLSPRYGHHLGDMDDEDEDEDDLESTVKQQSRDSRERTRKPLRDKVKAARKKMTKEGIELEDILALSRRMEKVYEAQHARENPEKYERDERKSQSNRERRMNDPNTGINSPAFQAFMAQQMGGKKKKKD